MNQSHGLDKIFEPGMDFVKREKELELERLKAKQPANDNQPRLTPAWTETLNRIGVPANGTAFYEPTPFEWQDPATIPLRDWIYGKHLLRGIVSMTIASGSVGKTSLKIVEALALATGIPLLGHDVPKRSRVWLRK